MRILRRPGFFLAALLACGGWFGSPALAAATPDNSEDHAFRFAFNLFRDRHFTYAETNFAGFLAKFTNSTRRPEAILYLARARLEQSNYTGAIELLQKSSPGVGRLAPDYRFWMAKARGSAGDYAGAAEEFASVAKDFPQSPLRLEASYDEAEARSRLGNWGEVIRLLQETNGPFRLAAAADPKKDFATMGWLLLGEALFQEQRYSDAETVVGGIDATGLEADVGWQRQYLLCRVELAEGQAKAALNNTTNLLALAYGPQGARHQAESLSLKGAILEKLGLPADALGVYAKNLVDSHPEVQRQALSRTVELTVALNPPAEAIQALEALIAQHPQASGLDLARTALGELYLKTYASPANLAAGSNAPAARDTNALIGALTNFNIVIRDFTNSPALAQARLYRGWCHWFEGSNGPAAVDFQEAASRLPFSQDQAMARFKLADAQFLQRDYAGAASNYSLVLRQYEKMPAVANGLFDLALYQIAQADINCGDENGARAAVEEILHRYPGSYYGDRSQLLLGEDLNRKYDYAKAREVFTNLLQRFPHSPLLPQVEYATNRTYDQEGLWNTAINGYRQWMTNHPGDALLPEVEFHLALALGKAGLATNALAGFTNFVARFPTNALAPWALNWVADYFYNQGDFSSAEKNYEQLFHKYPGAGDLSYQAQFCAGKAALARQGIEDAEGYFTNLLNDTNAPRALVDRTYFALGDTLFQKFQANTTMSNLDQAIFAMRRVTNGAPTNALAVEAVGRLGDYYMQWAALHPDTNSYAAVKQMYGMIAGFTNASVSASARSQAEVGLGWVAEQERQPELALTNYFKVLYFNPGSFDPYWVWRAGEAAARIYEDQQHWDQAVTVYNRVLDAAPSLRPVLEKKRAAAQSKWDAARN